MGWSLYERLELEVAVERHMLLSSLQSQGDKDDSKQIVNRTHVFIDLNIDGEIELIQEQSGPVGL